LRIRLAADADRAKIPEAGGASPRREERSVPLAGSHCESAFAADADRAKIPEAGGAWPRREERSVPLAGSNCESASRRMSIAQRSLKPAGLRRAGRAPGPTGRTFSSCGCVQTPHLEVERVFTTCRGVRR
jgi:hypothetical protein